MTPPLTPADKALRFVKIETDNTSGWIDVYDFFGEKVLKTQFEDAIGYVEFEIPKGEYYVYIRGDQSVFYSQVKINEDFDYTIKRLMLS